MNKKLRTYDSNLLKLFGKRQLDRAILYSDKMNISYIEWINSLIDYYLNMVTTKDALIIAVNRRINKNYKKLIKFDFDNELMFSILQKTNYGKNK